MFFKRKRRKEAEIQAVRLETLHAAYEATKSAEKLLKLLQEEKDLGTTGLLFYATGGDKRMVKKKGKK